MTFAIDVLGWIGAASLLGAYWLVSTQKVTGDSMTYQGMNLLGAILVLLNSLYYGAYPSVGVNAAWIAIGAYALARYVFHARHKQTSQIMVTAVIVTGGLGFHAAWAQQAGITRIDLQRHDLSIPGREVIQTIVELAPGVRSSRHTHPGEEIVYVLEGAPLEYELEGKPPVTLKPGDILFIPAGTVHSARNVGNRKGAELATYIVEKGKPLLVEIAERPPD
jgi:quercetin dioxygenase-like cupin family protein